MAKQVALDTNTYGRVVALSGELTAITRKSITLGMTVSCAVSILETILKTPAIYHLFKDRLRVSDLNSSDEFIDIWKWVATKAFTKKSS